MALTVCILAIYLKDGMIADFVDNSTATVTDMAYIKSERRSYPNRQRLHVKKEPQEFIMILNSAIPFGQVPQGIRNSCLPHRSCEVILNKMTFRSVLALLSSNIQLDDWLSNEAM